MKKILIAFYIILNLSLTKASEFVHQSSVNRANAICEHDFKGQCGSSAQRSLGDLAVSNSAKYAMNLLTGPALGNLGNNIKSNLPKQKPEAQTDVKVNNDTADTKKSIDLGKICRTIAITGAVASQASSIYTSQRNTEQYQRDTVNEIAQTDALYTMARTHDNYKWNNNAQGGIFGTVSACYFLAASKMASVDPQKAIEYGLYGGLGLVVTTASFINAALHDKTAKKAVSAAKSIDKVGSCDPTIDSQKNCFCVQEQYQSKLSHSALYEQHCVEAQDQRGDTTQIATACINSQGNVDHGCSCLETNSCYDKTVEGLFTDSSSPLFSKGPEQKEILDLVRKISTGSIDQGFTNKILDRAKSLSKQNDRFLAQNVKAIRSNPNGKKLSSALKSSGLSTQKAAILSTLPIKNSFFTAKKVNAYKSKAKPSKNKISFKSNFQNPSFQRSQTKSFSRSNLKKSKISNNLKIYKKARNLASINQNESKDIFKIISNRYLKIR